MVLTATSSAANPTSSKVRRGRRPPHHGQSHHHHDLYLHGYRWDHGLLGPGFWHRKRHGLADVQLIPRSSIPEVRRFWPPPATPPRPLTCGARAVRQRPASIHRQPRGHDHLYGDGNRRGPPPCPNSGSGTVTVRVPISATLANVLACPAGSATFSPVVTGTGPLTYVWKNPGGSTVGTEATLTINNAGAGDVGAYTVEITGPCNVVTASAQLGLHVAPAITAPAGEYHKDSG